MEKTTFRREKQLTQFTQWRLYRNDFAATAVKSLRTQAYLNGADDGFKQDRPCPKQKLVHERLEAEK